MNRDDISRFLLRCFLYSYAFLLVWGLLVAFLLPQLPVVYDIHERFFGVSRDQFELLNYALMGAWKLGAFFFFLIPWLALRK